MAESWKRTGTFGPELLRVLSALGAEKRRIDQNIGALLAAYADGHGLPPGSFTWDEQTGAWTYTPAPEAG